MLPRLSRLLKSIGRLRDPRPLSLDEWAEHHRPRVRRDVQRVLPHIPEGGTFVDIGANVGIFTDCVLEERPQARAFLFEPVRRYYERAVERFADNPRVRVVHIGLGEAPGQATIYKPRHNFGGNSIVREIVFDRTESAQLRKDTPLDEEQIELRPFSDLARELGIGDVDFVKTDAEGYDYAVLEGMLPWLRERSRLPVILAELLARHFHPRWERQSAVVAEIVALGYREIDLERLAKIDDVLFLPSEDPRDGGPGTGH